MRLRLERFWHSTQGSRERSLTLQGSTAAQGLRGFAAPEAARFDAPLGGCGQAEVALLRWKREGGFSAPLLQALLFYDWRTTNGENNDKRFIASLLCAHKAPTGIGRLRANKQHAGVLGDPRDRRGMPDAQRSACALALDDSAQDR
eukprot:366097-Chlamydomonas_euryale.AAC.21